MRPHRASIVYLSGIPAARLALYFITTILGSVEYVIHFGGVLE